jgi:integrase
MENISARKPRSEAVKKALKDSSLKALKPGPGGTRHVIWDALMPGMAVRVSAKGKRSFYAVKRRAGDAQPTWVLLGAYPVMTLSEAREAARQSLTALMAGEHPKALAEARRRAVDAAVREAAANTFGAIIERWLRFTEKRDDAPRESSMRMYKAYLNRALLPALGDKPMTKITRQDIISAIETVRDTSGNASARGAMALLGGILNWALDQGIAGYSVSPAAGLRGKNIIGGAVKRDRRLTDDELAAIWRAIPEVGEPFATVYKVLLLTGCRLAEIAEARWSEIKDGVLEVPAARSKNKLPMLVPLPPKAIELLDATPRFAAGDYIFTTTFGRLPVSAFSHAKARLDAALDATTPAFVVHEFRRCVRTNLSKLKVVQEIAEAVLGHKKPGIVGTYDLHEFFDEKRDALRRWEARLLAVVSPEPEPEPAGDNVVPMRARA